jgi:catechol 2,3-dioxygenase-like lactoylglutathione lyase family enzyme
MVILEVRDLAATFTFYRLLGLDIADPPLGRPLVIHRMPSGVSLLFTTGFAPRYDTNWVRPASGYQQMLEFYVGEDAAVETKYAELIDAGYIGRMPPSQTSGPFAAMVDDPDGNVILLRSDEEGSPQASKVATS